MADSEPVKKLTVIELAKQNLKRKPFRTVSLIVLTAVLAFSLFAGSFLVKSLNGGMQSLSNRLGADIIVVPQGYDSKIESALLRGEPNSFYFKSEVVILGLKFYKGKYQFFFNKLPQDSCHLISVHFNKRSVHFDFT